jgi:hypothetical protein
MHPSSVSEAAGVVSRDRERQLPFPVFRETLLKLQVLIVEATAASSEITAEFSIAMPEQVQDVIVNDPAVNTKNATVTRGVRPDADTRQSLNVKRPSPSSVSNE